MFKRSLPICLIIILALCLSSCATIQFSGGAGIVRGSGNVISETRNVSGFDSVLVTGSGEATITVGDAESVTIEADDNIIPLIDTTIQGSQLVISIKPGNSFSTTRTVRYTISAKTLKGLSLSGSANASVSPVKADAFTATTSGSGNIKIADLQGQSLTARSSGSGNIEVAAGKVDTVTITCSGSGNFTAGGLQGGAVQATTSGSGNITVWAKDTLNAKTSGSGNVRYYGQPAVTRAESGSGRVTSLGNK
jgi:hypothetical protein